MRATLIFQRGFLWVVACGLPACVRSDWLATWNSEIWYVHRERATWKDSWRFTLGSLHHVLDIRREFPEEASYFTYDPSICLLAMALGNVALVILGLLSSSIYRSLWFHPLLETIRGETATPVFRVLQDQWSLIAMDFLIALPVTVFSSGMQFFSGYRLLRNRHSGKAALFYLAKLLLVASAFDCMFTLAMSYPPLDFYGAVVGYILLLRWAVLDQQLRCPICLKRLGSPVHLGRLSWSILDWNLQEYVCSEGHGVMQIPNAPFMGQSTQEWLPLV